LSRRERSIRTAEQIYKRFNFRKKWNRKFKLKSAQLVVGQGYTLKEAAEAMGGGLVYQP